MKKILLGALGVLGLGAVTVMSLLQAGAIDMAADKLHSHAVYHLIEWVWEQSIARRAVGIISLDDLSDAGRIHRGAGNYYAMCANCHLSPGIEDSEIRKGLNPTPPNLSKPTNSADSDRTGTCRFWIIKHGIKASGMPSWCKGGMEDEVIWDLTAFLKIMQSLSLEEYRRQVEASNGHVHGGQEERKAEIKSKSDAEHPHDMKPHSHKH